MIYTCCLQSLRKLGCELRAAHQCQAAILLLYSPPHGRYGRCEVDDTIAQFIPHQASSNRMMQVRSIYRTAIGERASLTHAACTLPASCAYALTTTHWLGWPSDQGAGIDVLQF
jgi:hypothetical protein